MSASILIDALPAIRAPLAGGIYGGLINTPSKGLQAIVWAPKAQGTTRGQWLPKRPHPIIAASCHDSLGNTQAMAEAGSAIAQWALGLQIAGHSDWCIPARDVLELGYRHFKPSGEENYAGYRDGDNPSSAPPGYPYTEHLPAQVSEAEFRTDGDEAFDEEWHFSSTQASSSAAWSQDFSHGNQNFYHLSAEGAVRAVRLISVIA